VQGFVLNTDPDWYAYLRTRPALDEVNFWQPNGGRPLNTIEPFGPVLFRLTRRRTDALPHELGGRICGYGFYANHRSFPAWYAWELFGVGNGAPDRSRFLANLQALRRKESSGPPDAWEIGCILVAQPVFLAPDALVYAPADWSPRIQGGKTYDLSLGEGRRVWDEVRATPLPANLAAEPVSGWRESTTRVRIGQGIFRAEVIEAYGRACAVTREHSLPVVEAAHIVPYAERGVHELTNGLALRSDLHRLFDAHYITFDEDHRLVVSRRLRDEFANGRAYYRLQEDGARLHLPATPEHRPDPALLDIHRQRFARLAG
jgi:putative restriction endonuclease